jgi:predicted O-methyltransferase YrrM
MSGVYWEPKGMVAGSPEQHLWHQRWYTYQAALNNIYQDGMYAGPGSCMAPWDLLTLASWASGTPPGCFVEVGVYHGGSAYQLNRVALNQGRKLYLYDTFEGLPYDAPIDTLRAGELATSSLEEVRAAVGDHPFIVKGVFPNVGILPPAPIAFAHIDVDQYQSHIDTCRALAPRMASGGIMWFDDVPVLEGARQAVRDLFPAEAIKTEPNSGRWYVVFN